MSKFKVGDKIICFEGDPFKLLEEGQVYTIDTVDSLSVTLKELAGYQWFPQRFKLVSKQQYECPYAVIEELQCHVETLEEALEKATKELLELREKQSPTLKIKRIDGLDMLQYMYKDSSLYNFKFTENK